MGKSLEEFLESLENRWNMSKLGKFHHDPSPCSPQLWRHVFLGSHPLINGRTIQASELLPFTQMYGNKMNHHHGRFMALSHG